jgi:hypothetical protein
MPFSLHFNSRENTELLDISVLEVFSNCNGANNFDCIVFDTHFNQPISKLPDFIKKVEFGYYFKQDISNIGDHIESIIFQVAEFNYNLATFPKGLRELKIAGDEITSRIENINPGLETLTIQCESFNDELNLANTNITSIKILSNAFSRSLPELPLGLKSLEINCNRFNSPVDNLPPGLECLKISSEIFNQSIDNLPPGLKVLILDGGELFIHPLNNLPHGLEILNLYLGFHYHYHPEPNNYKHSLENLPNTIKKMVLSNYWGDLNTIGDCNGIVELDVWFPPHASNKVRTHIQHWNKIPSSLQILNINNQMARMKKVHDMVDIIKTNMNLQGIYVNGVRL